MIQNVTVMERSYAVDVYVMMVEKDVSANVIRRIRTQLELKIVDGIVAQKFVQEEGTATVEAANAKVDTQDDAVKSMLFHYVVETMIKFVLEMENASKLVAGAKTKLNVNVTWVTRDQNANAANQEIAKRIVSIALVIEMIPPPKCVLAMVHVIAKVEVTDKNASANRDGVESFVKRMKIRRKHASFWNLASTTGCPTIPKIQT